jgi:hypothetical protein
MRTSKAGEELALLTCKIWNDASASEVEGTPSGKPNFTIPLYLRGDILKPALQMDKQLFIVTESVLNVSKELGIKLKIEVPKLFGKGPASYSGATRTIVVENPLMATVLFSVTTSGAFQIKSSTDNAESSKKAIQLGASVTKSSSTLPQKGSSIGRTIQLLPQEKTSFVVVFTPKRDMRDALLTMASVEASKERTSDGLLTISFSTGQRIEVPMTAILSTPFISGYIEQSYMF